VCCRLHKVAWSVYHSGPALAGRHRPSWLHSLLCSGGALQVRAPEQYIMSTQTPKAPPPPVAATLSPSSGRWAQEISCLQPTAHAWGPFHGHEPGCAPPLRTSMAAGLTFDGSSQGRKTCILALRLSVCGLPLAALFCSADEPSQTDSTCTAQVSSSFKW